MLPWRGQSGPPPRAGRAREGMLGGGPAAGPVIIVRDLVPFVHRRVHRPGRSSPIAKKPGEILMTTIAPFLEMAKAGHREAAFHGLLELGDAVLPLLGEVYRGEPDPAVRSLLVEVIWQLRSPSSLDVLGEALQDPAPEVWRQALDGLVTLASPESLRILESARDGLAVSDAGGSTDIREWIDEAVEDVRGRIDE